MRWLIASLLAVLFSPPAYCSPAVAISEALADLQRQPAVNRPYLRYLSLYTVPADKQADFARVLDFWANSLSREADLTPLVRVSPSLLRLDIRDYGWAKETWEALADADPYFHVKIVKEVEEVQHWKGGYDGGKYYPPGRYKVKRKKQITALAPWLPTLETAKLVTLSQSQAPVVRGDWWLVQTGQQEGRKGTGYYDFLRLKSRNDFQKLVSLDRKLAEKVQREVHAIVGRSNVTLQNRQIRRLGTILGAYWESRDTPDGTGKGSAIRNLDKDYKHVAEEIYAHLPNGLFAFYLSSADGVQANTAPDNIASDGQAPGTDRRVHVGVSCVRCHVEGLRPIDDWARSVYQPPIGLGAVDPDQFRRLKRLYLSDLDGWVSRDVADYSRPLFALTGWKTQEAARAFAKSHAHYEQADLNLADVARETGHSEERVKTTLLRVVTSTPPLDPVLASLVSTRTRPIRREHFEEVFPLLMVIVK